MNADEPDRAPDAMAPARSRVLEALEKLAGADEQRPPALSADRPLRQPDAALEAKLAARCDAGLSEAGPDHPRRSAAVAAAALLLVLGVAGVVALVLVAVIGGLAVGGAGIRPVVIGLAAVIAGVAIGAGAVGLYSAGDPLRLTSQERREVQAARSWQSAQPWVGPPAAGRERRLVLLARDIVARIVGSRAWASPELEVHRAQLDLTAELDQIDAQAYDIAVARLAEDSAPESGDAVDHGWRALVDRVAALAEYAEKLDRLHEELVEEQAAQIDLAVENRNAELLAGAARDDFAADRITDLAEDLGVRRTYRARRMGKLAE